MTIAEGLWYTFPNLGKNHVLPINGKMVAKLSKWAGLYGTKYRVGELVHAGKLFHIEDGIYADTADVPEVEVVLAKYPSSVLTLESAYYYYNMSDEIPDEYHLATDRKSARIVDDRVVQSYVPCGTLMIGATEIDVLDEHLRIYDKERLLIETMRYRTKLPYDLYREVIGSFREIRNELYGSKIDDYLKHIPRMGAIMEAIRKEVY